MLEDLQANTKAYRAPLPSRSSRTVTQPLTEPLQNLDIFPLLVLLSEKPRPCLYARNQYFRARTYQTTLLVLVLALVWCWPGRGSERQEEGFWNVLLEDAEKDK